MKRASILLTIMILSFTTSFAALTGTCIPYNPGSGFSGTASICMGATATPINYNYASCGTGSGTATGTACIARWYYNTTNSNVVTDATVQVGSSISFNSAATANGNLPSVIPVTTTAGTYYYFCVVSWSATGTCAASFKTAAMMVTIKAAPAAIGGTLAICPGTTTTLTDASSGVSWASSTPAVATITNGGVMTGVNTGTTTITYNSTTGCYATATATILATPATITGAGNTCTGTATTLSCSTAGGTWCSSNTAVATAGSAGCITGVSTGTSMISYTAGGCRRTMMVTVNAMPAAISGIAGICTGSSVTMATSATGGGAWSSNNTGVATVGSTGVVTGVTVDTVSIAYTTTAGCRRSTVVTVSAAPVITGVASVCYAFNTTLTPSLTGGNWSSGNLATGSVDASSGVVHGNGAGIAPIMYTYNAGCKVITNVTVNALPAAITGAAAVCNGSSTTLSNTSAGTWSSSDAAIATIGSATGVVYGASAGTPTISFITPAGCYSTRSITIGATVPAPYGSNQVCTGATTVLTPVFYGQSFTSSDTAIAPVCTLSGVVSGVSAGTATITFTPYSNSAYAGCIATVQMTVSPAPAAIAGATAICVGSTTTLTDATAGGAWSVDYPASATVNSTSGLVTGVAYGSPTITYTLPTGCTATHQVTVNPSAAISGTMAMCNGTSSALSADIAGGTWASGNAAIATVDASGTVNGIAAGNTAISYTTTQGCISAATVTVNAAPDAITGTMTVCQGDSTAMNDNSTGGTWSSSDAGTAAISTAGMVTGNAAGTAIITYTLPTTCTATAIVTVNAAPAAIAGALGICEGLTTTLTDATTGGTWSGGTAGIATINSATGLVMAIVAGSAAVSYTATNGCITASTITVNPLPAMITGAASVCVSSTVTLIDASAGGAWSTSDTALATATAAGDITGQWDGLVTITYTLPTGCITTKQMSVGVFVAPITGPATVIVGSTILLSDATPGGFWSTLDPSTATVSGGGTVTGVSAGSTRIYYTFPNGCGAITTPYLITIATPRAEIATAGTESITFSATVIPNPNNGAFTLSTTSGSDMDVEVLNISGEVIYRQHIAAAGAQAQPVALDSAIPNGMYLMAIRNGSEQKVMNFVVRK